MATILVVFGVIVAVIVAVVFPWALLRKLEGKGKNKEREDG